MRYMALPVSFRWDKPFIERIDAARGDVPRTIFVQRAVEQVLAGYEVTDVVRDGVKRQPQRPVRGRVTGSPSLQRFKGEGR